MNAKAQTAAQNGIILLEQVVNVGDIEKFNRAAIIAEIMAMVA